jgi:hypothetical protein
MPVLGGVISIASAKLSFAGAAWREAARRVAIAATMQHGSTKRLRQSIQKRGTSRHARDSHERVRGLDLSMESNMPPFAARIKEYVGRILRGNHPLQAAGWLIDGGRVELTGCTFASNSAMDINVFPSAGKARSGGVDLNRSGFLRATDCGFLNNIAANDAVGRNLLLHTGPGGEWLNQGHNTSSDGSAPLPGKGSVVSRDPGSLPLADNGGSTLLRPAAVTRSPALGFIGLGRDLDLRRLGHRSASACRAGLLSGSAQALSC